MYKLEQPQQSNPKISHTKHKKQTKHLTLWKQQHQGPEHWFETDHAVYGNDDKIGLDQMDRKDFIG